MLSFQVPAGAGSADRAGPAVARNRRADSIQMVRGMTRFLCAYRERQHENDTPAMELLYLPLIEDSRAMAPLKTGASDDTLEQATELGAIQPRMDSCHHSCL